MPFCLGSFQGSEKTCCITIESQRTRTNGSKKGLAKILPFRNVADMQPKNADGQATRFANSHDDNKHIVLAISAVEYTCDNVLERAHPWPILDGWRDKENRN